MLRRSVEIRPTAAALSNLGTTRFFLGRYEEAAQVFEKAVELSPRDATARLNLGRAYFVAPGMREKSRAPLGQALALLEQESAVNPREAGLIAGQADAHAMLGHAKQARALSARAVALAPDDADVLAVVASVDETFGDRAAALQKISRAIANGYPRWEIERDPALRALREDPRFADVLTGVTPTPVEKEKKPQ